MEFDVDRERERQRRSYRFCFIGFSLLAVSLTLGAAYMLFHLLMMFAGRGGVNLGTLLGIDNFEFLFLTFRTWARVISCGCLFAAWSQPSWRRRTGLLVVISVVDVVVWAWQNGRQLGIGVDPPVEHELLLQGLGYAMSWAKLFLYAGLCVDFARHLAIPKAVDFGNAAQVTASTGAAVWFYFFMNQVDWRIVWPLVQRRWNRDMFLLYLTFLAIQTICLIQTSLLSLIATAGAARAIREMTIEDRRRDAWPYEREETETGAARRG